MKTLHSNVSVLKRRENIAGIWAMVMGVAFVMTLAVFCIAVPPAWTQNMDISQTISDGAQQDTIAFDGFASITGNLDAQSFFPPGKVADYFGFQYLRDNAPNGIGHNTDFLTNCSINVLYILNSNQFAQLMTLANNQVNQINLYAYKRFPLMEAFRRQINGDIPTGASGLSLSAVMAASNDLYTLDGQISFDRAVAYASIINSLSASQIAYLNSMKAGGFASWTVTDAMNTFFQNLTQGVSNDVCVALMSYAGDIFAWYAGSLDADVYFCPERQGNYFGSFYVKDAPAVGHPGYQISTALTGDVGQEFLNELVVNQLDTLVTNLVDEQRDNLYTGTVNIVQVRTDISTLLRSLLTAPTLTDQLKASVLAQVLEKSGVYGELDGQISYDYAMAFSTVSKSLTTSQTNYLTSLRETLLSGVYNGVPFDFTVCTTPFLYSAVITDTSVLGPYISNTDYLFGDNTVAITISPLKATVQNGKTQQFTANVSGTTDTGVIWQVNGVTGGNATVGTISTSGVYTAPLVAPNPSSVTITAITGADTTKSANATVTVTVAPPSASFTFAPTAPVTAQQVVFKDASTGGPTSWSWKFGDGSTSTSRNPTHTYSKAGNYTVTLVAGNAGGSSSSTQTLTVKTPKKG